MASEARDRSVPIRIGVNGGSLHPDLYRKHGDRVTPEAMVELRTLSKDTRLVFHCHHGGRSQAAGQEFVGMGFTNVSNLVGGIDAWSTQIDTSIPRY